MQPKHVSSGIVVLNVRWSLIRVVSQERDYCSIIIWHLQSVVKYYYYSGLILPLFLKKIHDFQDNGKS